MTPNLNKILEDGHFLVNHKLHPSGIRERIIEIKNGIVNVENFSFSQSSFFEVNYVVKKI